MLAKVTSKFSHCIEGLCIVMSSDVHAAPGGSDGGDVVDGFCEPGVSGMSGVSGSDAARVRRDRTCRAGVSGNAIYTVSRRAAR